MHGDDGSWLHEIAAISEAKRKDPVERKRLIDSSDIVFLCLPDDSARESASLAGNPKTRILDASTAFRTSDEWAYGRPSRSRRPSRSG